MKSLEHFFKENQKVALSFSGGTDSAYLLYVAKKYGCDIKAYHVKSFFQPRFEFEDAKKIVQELQLPMEIITIDVLTDEMIRRNPVNRCYYCKKLIFSKIIEAAHEDGYSMVIDGTNASDDEDDRPGMAALQELQIRSPLRECRITKAEVRSESQKAGLFTWDKPAYACLATRVSVGSEITIEQLAKIEQIEKRLWKMGYRDFRVRLVGERNMAKLQVKEEQMKKAIQDRKQILKILGDYFSEVVLDMQSR